MVFIREGEDEKIAAMIAEREAIDAAAREAKRAEAAAIAGSS